MRPIVTILTTLCVLTTLLALDATSAAAQDSEGTGNAGPAEISIPGTGIFDQMTRRPVGIPDMDTEKEPFRVPDDPTFAPTMAPPSDPPVEAGDGDGEDDGLGKTVAPVAAGDYVAYLNSNLTVTDGANSTSVIDEPSLGVNGRVVFYTGNWFAAFSGDGGQTFQYVDPYDNFPANGTPDVPANAGGFCCDQVVHYEPTRGMMVWFLQYNRSGNNATTDSNVFRVAIADSQEDVLNNNWYSWTFNPALFGLPAAGVWMDYPDMSFTNEYLYITTNVFNIVPGPDTYNTSLIIRLGLDDLADAGGLGYRYWSRSGRTLRPVQNATTRMYIARHEDSNTLRVYYVDDSSTTLNSQDVDHAGYNRLVGTTDVMNAAGPDGTNFAGRSDSRILGAWRSAASGEIGFMWNADESDGSGDISANYPFPYTRIVRIRTSDWSVQQQRSIYSNSYAWIYPSVNVNDRGHLGGTIANGGGARHPRSYAWIVDDYNSPNAFPSFTNIEVNAFATGNDGPNANTWGDYLTTRKMVPYGNTWVGTGFRLANGGGNANTVPEYLWFGRERDMPPAANTIYVNHTNTSGHEDGTLSHPFNTADEGEVALQPGDHLRISTGTYNESVVFDTQADVNNRSGTAIIVAGGPGANAEARLKASEDQQEMEAAADQDEESDPEEEEQ
ncbi:hypothetical protein ACFLRO_01260 [Bacteroidota bacterium]